jgi:DNA invertase Pin-like site-specific DNA recombinase
MTETAIALVRVSTQEQADRGISLEVQEEAVRSYCALKGLRLIHVHKEAGESTIKPLARRSGGKQVLAALRENRASHVVAYKLDRLFRDVLDCRTHVDQWDHDGVALHLVDLGGQTLDTSTAMGKFAITVLAAAAELERGKIRENTKAALEHKKSKGLRTGRVPFGFRLAESGRHDGKGKGSLEKDPDEQRILRRIKGLRTRGWAIRAIAKKLNDEGIANRGRPWYPTTVARLLQRKDRS